MRIGIAKWKISVKNQNDIKLITREIHEMLIPLIKYHLFKFTELFYAN